ncbi:AGE family epimerase/isomerase [bacterium]|nr:AGE family epimerase/isomerase [bacterium]
MGQHSIFNKPYMRTAGADRSSRCLSDDGTLAGMTPEALRDRFLEDLLGEYLPYLERYAVDHEYGGFMCNVRPDGTRIDTVKRAWYEGRGIWLYSFLYNKIEGERRFLEMARRTVDFILALKPEGDVFWPATYTREGKPLSEGEIYGDLFIAMGLQEFAKIPGNERYRNEAKAILMKCLRMYDRPDYPGKPFLPGGPDIVAPRMLGHWMLMLRVSTQYLEAGPDTDVEGVAGRCIDALLNHHYNPGYGLFNEVLNHDFSRTAPENPYSQWSYTGHAIEVLWFMLDEALRRKDSGLFDTAADLFMRHVEIAWDDGFGGVFRSLDNVMKNIWTLDVVLLFQLEALIGCMLLVEHTGSPWSKTWYSKFYHFIRDRFEPVKSGFSPWTCTGDRADTPAVFSAPRIGNFHYPQCLIYNILSLDRMIQRGGMVSSAFA